MGVRKFVPIANKAAGSQVITVENGATDGAVVGDNLWLQDGTVVTFEMLFPGVAPGTTPGTTPDDTPPVLGDGGEGGIIYWGVIQEIPPNIVALAALAGKGHPYREVDGTWRLRKSGRAVINFTFGDATPAPIYTLPEGAANVLLRVVIDTPFNGAGASLSLSAASGPVLLPSSAIAPSIAGGYEAAPDVILLAGDVIRLAITPGAGATAGAGKIIVDTIPILEN